MFLPLIFKHPLTKNNSLSAFNRYFKWHINKFLNREQFVYNIIGNTKIHINRDDHAALVNYYSGLYEFEEMCFLLHFLREVDLMIDAGANVGVFSLLASGYIGCDSVSFEPIPTTFKKLKANIELNKLRNIEAFNVGLGSENGTLKFTNNTENSTNRVADENDKDVILVEIKKLDDIVILKKEYESIIMKVDVEGFETEVLKGAKNILENYLLKAIIIELNGSGKKYGFDETEIKKKLEGYGFKLLFYHPFERSLLEKPIKNSWGNAIYVRDEKFAKRRVLTANKISILGKNI